MSQNIVLITVDSLRADHCSFVGHERETTPTLDAMAEEGVVFENAIAPGPSTPESMPAIFTGEPIGDVRRGVTSRDQIRTHLSRSRTIPERLTAAGYSTVGYTPNPFTSRYFGFDQGFDRFHDFLDSGGRLQTAIVSRWMQGRFVAGLRFGVNMLGHGDVSMTWEDYYDELLQSVDDVPNPFFLWIFLLEPHWPYRPPRRFRDGVSSLRMHHANWVSSNFSNATPSESGAETTRSLYDGTIRHVDEFVSRFTSDLDDDTVFVFHADHGEAFGEHGSFGHGTHLFDENVRVPLLIWNGKRERAERVRDPVSLRSLPFILQTLVESDGAVDFSQFTRSRVSASTGEKSAVRGRDWKLIRDEKGIRYYNLLTDPAERRPLSGTGLNDLWERVNASDCGPASERERIASTSKTIEVTNL